ncbi:hypothetical protein Tco_0132870 [Tanacetum coccineum]
MVVQNQSELGEDEAVHKELGDSLVRAATTTSSLEAEQDSGNITKTRSKATPNESSSLGTTSGGGPRCQETMEILLLELESLNMKKKSLGDDASKQGRINVIDADEEITLVSVHDDTDKEMFDVVALNDEEPMKKKVQIMLAEETALKLQAEFDEEERLAREKTEKEKEANIALIEEWDDIQAKIDDDHQLAERLQAQEQEELSDAEKATLFQQLLEKRRKHFAAKRAKEKRNKPPIKAQQ